MLVFIFFFKIQFIFSEIRFESLFPYYIVLQLNMLRDYWLFSVLVQVCY